MDVFFISHEDFIADTDKEIGSVRQRMNQMAFQKFRFTKKEDTTHVKYTLKIDKSKYKPQLDGQEYTLLTIDKNTKKYNWQGLETWKKILDA